MRTIVYLHGFISAPGSKKATILRDYVERCVTGIRLVVPALHHRPARAIEQVRESCEGIDAAGLTLVGSSLGGFYATVMAERLGCRAALVNPAPGRFTNRVVPSRRKVTMSPVGVVYSPT